MCWGRRPQPQGRGPPTAAAAQACPPRRLPGRQHHLVAHLKGRVRPVPIQRRLALLRYYKKAEAVQKHDERFTNDTFLSLLLCSFS